MARLIGFGSICNFTANEKEVYFSVPTVDKDFIENTTVIPGGIAHFPSAGPSAGTVTRVGTKSPYTGLRVTALASITSYSATLIAKSVDAEYLKAQIVFVPADPKLPPEAKLGIPRVNVKDDRATFTVTPLPFQPVGPGVFQVRLATTKVHPDCHICGKAHPVKVAMLENDAFTIMQYETLPLTGAPDGGDY